MKTKLLLTITLATLLVSQMSAQITVNSSSLIPIGYVALQAHDTLPVSSIFPGPGGTNQVWNFGALHNHTYDTMNTMDPTGTPYASDFTTANYAYDLNNNTTYGFLQNNTTGLYLEGIVGNIGDPGNHVIKEYVAPHGTLMKWPSTYGTNYTDNYTVTAKGQFDAFAPFDSIRVKNIITSTCQIDAWGNILIPLGTFPSLRHWRHKIETDSSWAHQISPPMWILADSKKDTVDTYTWWTNSSSIGLPLLEMDYKAATNTASKVKWLYSNPTLGIAEDLEGVGFITYPNPATNFISIQQNEKKDYTISIFDITGKVVVLNQQTKGAVTTINTESLNPGLYFVALTNKEGKRSVRKISIVH